MPTTLLWARLTTVASQLASRYYVIVTQKDTVDIVARNFTFYVFYLYFFTLIPCFIFICMYVNVLACDFIINK